MAELFKEFREFKKILCVCPCCGELVRVSELKLRVKGPAPKTWLDEHEEKVKAVEKKEERFEEIKKEMREVAVERGRKEAVKIVKKTLAPQIRALRLDPMDVKPILNPIDFVVFKGMTKNHRVTNIMMLSKKSSNAILNKYRRQIKTAVEKKYYEWQTVRIDEDGNIEVG